MLRYEGAGADHEEKGNDPVSLSLSLSLSTSTSLSLSLLCFNQLLVQAAHWKLQTKELKEQGTVMQTQVTISQIKFTSVRGAELNL